RTVRISMVPKFALMVLPAARSDCLYERDLWYDFGDSPLASAARTVLSAALSRRTLSLIRTSSDLYNRRISVYRSISITVSDSRGDRSILTLRQHCTFRLDATSGSSAVRLNNSLDYKLTSRKGR